ncbi:MAG: hypothetical protein ACYCVL_01500 [Gemmatimonadaceae bacterium]
MNKQHGSDLIHFAWSYSVAATIPVSIAPDSSNLLQYEDAVRGKLRRVLLDIAQVQGNPIRFAHHFDSSRSKCTLAELLIGNISRLRPKDVEALFHDWDFHGVSVMTWNPTNANPTDLGYLPITYASYSDLLWDFNVRWNDQCERGMISAHNDLLAMLSAVSPEELLQEPAPDAFRPFVRRSENLAALLD